MCFNLKLLLMIFLHSANQYGEAVTDMNMAHFQYLANNLHPGECRKLVTSLHFNSDDIPQSDQHVIKDESCLQQLLHWNVKRSGGHGATHEIIARRLKQLGRNDLANWLTNASFNTINKSLDTIDSEKTFRMYEPLHLPYINITTKLEEATEPQLRVTTAETLIRVVKQNAPDPVEDIVVDPTEWTIFDTISWSIVIILFLLIIVLLVYLTLASPCFKRKSYVQCSASSTPRGAGHEYNSPPSNHSSPISYDRAPNQYQECKNQTRHFESTYPENKSSHAHKKHHNEYSICGNSECPAQPYHYDYNTTRYMREYPNDCKRQTFSESPPYNEGSYIPKDCPCKVPPAPRPICHGGNSCLANDYNDGHVHHNGSRTIDIHQKIAIPMNNLENSN